MQKESAGSSPPLNERKAIQRRSFISLLRSRSAIGIAIFFLAFGVRVLTWHDTRLDVGKVQTSVVADYQRIAQLLRTGGVSSFFSPSSPLADLNNLGHPPGYSLLLAIVYSISQSEAAVQFVQITADSFSAVLIFMIVAELWTITAAVVAGSLAALSPQLAWNSVLLLPDSISVLPILLAIFLLARALKRPRLLKFVLVGALIGVSCWLRANAMLLIFFVAIAVAILTMPPKRWQFALAVICGTLLIVLPLTIRNAIVFRRFIPLSLGAGQTFLEGIADYDKAGRFGVPDTDMGIMKQESEIYQRPDYYGTLFNPDGVERERARLSRGFAVVRSHPLWFAGVMAKRASSMLRLERSRLISAEPPISHSIAEIDRLTPTWSAEPDALLAKGRVLSPQAYTSLAFDTCCWLGLVGDSSHYGDQFSFPIDGVKKDVDYVLILPVSISSGRMRISVKGPDGNTYITTTVEAPEVLRPSDPVQQVVLPFVPRNNGQVQIFFSNEASSRPNPIITITEVRFYELGPSRFLWTRYPRFLIHAIQKLFLTAVILPLATVGLLILIFRKQRAALVILGVVPVYFFLVQSLVHTEYRYVIAVTYVLFAFAGIAIGCGIDFVVRKLRLNGARPPWAA
jgi:Dolichyl-phosphate-mannose-protein mannosyltransferase